MRLLTVLLSLAALAPISCAFPGDGAREPASPSAPDRRSPGTEGGPARGSSPGLPAHGLSSWENAGIPTADLEAIRRSGAAHYRFNMITSFVDWNGLSRTTRRYDRIVREAAVRDIALLPVLMSLRTIKRPSPPRTPAERARWRTLVGFFASRYGHDGAFWRENPDLPYRPIRAWEVWNEPNLRQFWDGRPRAREYVPLLAETRAALRAADPDALIVSAGLAWRRGGPRYLRSMLAHGDPCLFDAVGLHPYANSVGQSLAYVEEARSILDRSAARDTPLWITEIGWRVAPRGRYSVPTPFAQGRSLAAFAAAAERRRDELGLGPVFAFALRDRDGPRPRDRARPRGPRGRAGAAGREGARPGDPLGRAQADRRSRAPARRRPPGHDYGMLPRGDLPRPAWEAWSAAAQREGPLPRPPLRRCEPDAAR